MQPHFTNICSVRIWDIYLKREPKKTIGETHIIKTKAMKQSKELKGDLKPEPKKTTNKATMSLTIHIDRYQFSKQIEEGTVI